MVSQMTNIEELELQLERKVERYQRKYKITHAEVAWALLRMGTIYYFKDICSRATSGNGDLVMAGTVDAQYAQK